MVDKFPDWFSAYAKPNFERFLIPLAGQGKLKFLQLGAYTGDATVWMCTHILTAQSSILDDVDTWRGSNELAHESIDFDEVYRVYLKRIYEWSDTVKVHRRDSTAYLMDDWTQHKEYDFIYIDADHTAVSVLLDAELSWPLLKSGGIMAFDDYQWGPHLHAFKSPKLGIDLFLERHAGEYELLESGLQVWIRKL